MKDYLKNDQKYKELGIKPEVYDFSELEDYVMVCRVIGKDKQGNVVFPE